MNNPTCYYYLSPFIKLCQCDLNICYVRIETMDILAHMLWANYGARGLNKKLEKKKNRTINLKWVTFWGVFPDLFAFTIPFCIAFFSVIFGGQSLGALRNHHGLASGFDIASFLYQFSHSLVIWALVFIVIWIISKRPRLELLGWLLHILIDIPSHAASFYPTPFLFPLSDYRFLHGVSWGNKWYMIINYSLLLITSLYFFSRKKKVNPLQK